LYIVYCILYIVYCILYIGKDENSSVSKKSFDFKAIVFLLKLDILIDLFVDV